MVAGRLAVIPARGGSRRIPGKNVLDFRGRPLIEWTIVAALQSAAFEHVLVFTDEEGIADVARDAGADVPFLRQSYTDDHSPVSLATCSAVEQAESQWGTRYHTIVQLMANCPLRTHEHVLSALSSFEAQGRRFQISACRFGWMNPWWAARIDGDGEPDPLFPEARMRRSQDLPALFFPTGAVWIAQRDALLESRDFYGPGYVFEEMPWTAGVDIDELDDLEFADAVAEMRLRRDSRKMSGGAHQG